MNTLMIEAILPTAPTDSIHQPDTDEAIADFQRWRQHIGDYVRFIDEQAVIEAHHKGTKYPIMYHGRIQDVIVVSLKQTESVHLVIKPMWTDTPTFIHCALCSLVES